jgi:hypothetical protein
MKRVTCLFCGLINFSSAKFYQKCKKDLSACQIITEGKIIENKQSTTLGQIVFKNRLLVMAKVVLFSSIGFSVFTLFLGLFYRDLIKEGEFAGLAMLMGVIPFLRAWRSSIDDSEKNKCLREWICLSRQKRRFYRLLE